MSQTGQKNLCTRHQRGLLIDGSLRRPSSSTQPGQVFMNLLGQARDFNALMTDVAHSSHGQLWWVPRLWEAQK
jgi:hypothetical protein